MGHPLSSYNNDDSLTTMIPHTNHSHLLSVGLHILISLQDTVISRVLWLRYQFTRRSEAHQNAGKAIMNT
jgi:hypothetical protein